MGHFTAREINYKYFSGSGTKEIKIYPCESDLNVYCGHTTPILPIDAKPNKPVPLERLPEHLASLTYGCIFQSYHLKEESLKQCWRLNGELDAKAWFGSLSSNSLDQFTLEIAKEEENYYSYLISENKLDEFMKLSPSSYLIESSDNFFEFNIEKLKTETAQLIESHYPNYSKLVDKYSLVLGINK